MNSTGDMCLCVNGWVPASYLTNEDVFSCTIRACDKNCLKCFVDTNVCKECKPT
jgi:hypothetical protein